jgi:RNA polymerase sigma factor (sigma-70 family)
MANGPAGIADADDKALMLRFQEQGELSAFETLFNRHRAHLLRYLRKLAHSADVAEEISQQTWLKVIEAARTAKYNPDLRNTFGTWLYTLARNHYVDRYVRAYAVKNRASSPAEYADALREAQLLLLRGAAGGSTQGRPIGSPYADPFFWAPYILLQPLR